MSTEKKKKVCLNLTCLHMVLTGQPKKHLYTFRAASGCSAVDAVQPVPLSEDASSKMLLQETQNALEVLFFGAS